ncbi:hypothetical protein [Actinacidiphila acididurans]|uniref:Uncharacterized protein n=1 Tax=Actinacidiphila acididurans TaxID=2784346 RepID=A0ABS2TU83_9ACTN|nr:hypothetical protein [Actinacidiphila acididurans]
MERTATLMNSLLGVKVSSGFVARARLAERLAAAGFDEAMEDALCAGEVLCGDESPVHVLCGGHRRLRPATARRPRTAITRGYSG